MNDALKIALRRCGVAAMDMWPNGRIPHPWMRRRVTVFMLHRIETSRGGDGTSRLFLRDTLRYLKRKGYGFVSLEEVLDTPPSDWRSLSNAVCFTMDDGFRDQAEVAAPIFLEFGVPATMFVVTGFLDGKLWPWDAKLDYLFARLGSRKVAVEVAGRTVEIDGGEGAVCQHRGFRELCRRLGSEAQRKAIESLAAEAGLTIPDTPPGSRYEPMSWEQARLLEREGFRFAPHSISHRILARLDPCDLHHEIAGSWERVEQEVNHPLPVFCFPTGRSGIDFGQREVDAVRGCGLEASVSADPGYYHPLEHKPGSVINRFSFPDDREMLIQCCTGMEYMKDRVRSVVNETQERIQRRIAAAQRALYSARLGLVGIDRHERIDWSAVRRLVFVCKGNVCRSAFAEGVAKQRMVAAVSCGLDTTTGSPANATAKRIATEWAVDLSPHQTKAIHDLQLNRGDLLLAMEVEQAQRLRREKLPDWVQVSVLGLWSEVPQTTVVDPYGKDDGVFRRCFDLIDRSVAGVERRLVASLGKTAPTHRQATNPSGSMAACSGMHHPRRRRNGHPR